MTDQKPTAEAASAGFRDYILTFDFVTTAPGGGIDLWNPPKPKDRAAGFNQGRYYTAQAVQAMKMSGDSALAYHLNAAQRKFLGAGCPVLEGALYEMAYVICSTPLPPDMAVLVCARWDFQGESARDALESLPWTGVKADGAFDSWATSSTGCWRQDRALGRYYGAVLCRLIHQTRWFNIFYAQPDTPPRDEEILVGMFHLLGEVLIDSPGDCTGMSRAARAVREAPRPEEALSGLPDFSAIP